MPDGEVYEMPVGACPSICSPLDEIRQAEAEVTRRVAAARQAAEATAQKAHAQAEGIRRHAREAGQREGEVQYREIVSQAKEDARALIAQAQRRAETLRRQGDLCMDDIVRNAVEIVVGQEQRTIDE